MGNSQCLVRATEKNGRKIDQQRYIVGARVTLEASKVGRFDFYESRTTSAIVQGLIPTCNVNDVAGNAKVFILT